jgi:hypothetical protein
MHDTLQGTFAYVFAVMLLWQRLFLIAPNLLRHFRHASALAIAQRFVGCGKRSTCIDCMLLQDNRIGGLGKHVVLGANHREAKGMDSSSWDACV